VCSVHPKCAPPPVHVLDLEHLRLPACVLVQRMKASWWCSSAESALHVYLAVSVRVHRSTFWTVIHSASIHWASIHSAYIHSASIHSASPHSASIHSASIYSASDRSAQTYKVSVSVNSQGGWMING
jgi:hypothetical protein